MPRFPRLVVPDYPHHVTQRGNRRQPIFFSDSDYEAYLDLLAQQLATAKVDVLAYCLMPNHVARSSLAGTLPLFRYGRGASTRGGEVRRAQPGPRRTLPETGGVAMVQRAFSHVRAR